MVGGQAPDPDPKGHEMKLSSEVRADAKRYNAEWSVFEGYDRETGESVYYKGYGVAYRYVSAKVLRGANMCIIGHRTVEDPSDEYGFRVESKELIGC